MYRPASQRSAGARSKRSVVTTQNDQVRFAKCVLYDEIGFAKYYFATKAQLFKGGLWQQPQKILFTGQNTIQWECTNSIHYWLSDTLNGHLDQYSINIMIEITIDTRWTLDRHLSTVGLVLTDSCALIEISQLSPNCRLRCLLSVDQGVNEWQPR